MSLSGSEVSSLMELLKTAKKGFAAPPWLRYPTMPFGSGFWRMGGGESHIMEWGAWLRKSLSAEQRSLYTRAFPSPRAWNVFHCNYYDNSDSDDDDDDSTENRTPEQRIADDAGVTLWTPDGKPGVCSRDSLLAEGTAANLKRDFIFFWGHKHDAMNPLSNAVFSQWWMEQQDNGRPTVQFSEDVDDFVCAEQYMMAAKAMVFNDDDTRSKILAAVNPATMKKLGREVKRFDATVWNVVAFSVVAQGNYLKFTSNPALKKLLLDTGDAVLVEAAPNDTIWGIGRSVSDAQTAKVNLKDAKQWKGTNLLGFALMEAREEIRRVHQYRHLLPDLEE